MSTKIAAFSWMAPPSNIRFNKCVDAWIRNSASAQSNWCPLVELMLQATLLQRCACKRYMQDVARNKLHATCCIVYGGLYTFVTHQSAVLKLYTLVC